ncbi:MAG: D-alanyl-D-alanine carboxypeptidase/D-alanyl-D-alanine endopeptidase [Giesbergeria sp.]
MLSFTSCCRPLVALAVAFLALPPAWAAPTDASALPPAVAAALTRAGIPRDAMAALVVPVDGNQAARLAWRVDAPMNPASVMKLTTTFAALDLLGPAYTWRTPVYVQGPVQAGTLQGNLYLRGSGDPTLVMERLWLLLRRVQARGISTIAGDIVVDGTAFTTTARDPGAFDGEPQRAYNAAPEALLVNFKSVVLDWAPDLAAGVARVQASPPLAGLSLPTTVPLAPAGTPCGDWHARVRLNMADPARWVFEGSYPAACGERSWAIAPPQPELFAPRAVAGMWQALGGKLGGKALLGSVPPGLTPLLVHTSPPLQEAVQSVNKFSNNVMAEQLFLTLGLEQGGVGSPEAARSAMQAWWQKRMDAAAMPVFDNGSGLSREGRISAAALARLLQTAWASPVMPELMASLPIVGIDGTLRRSRSRTVGNAHLKTGSLQGVQAIAGYVLANDGRRWVLVAIVNHDNAAAARPALEALIDWAGAAAGP